MIKIVLDTNVFVSALISTRSNSALLLDAAGKNYSLFVSRELISELEDVISRKKFGFTNERINAAMEAILSFSGVVNPGIKLDVIKSDPDDNKILECAVACGADYLVSGDAHLLELKEYKGIKVKTPKAALDILNIQ
ncbi:MAG: putative toxin-antitoxin system toxin component, PIN family [Candidatus Methanoperedens sp.]|nr:putative toxin-antitoxin system toxin component, PIN family [Candidatus Methanoperedens sp.]MCZ7405526.1 putative toxin-antitoxin system toxin component, PIN family [Candidatus Methanoperedens sp.]